MKYPSPAANNAGSAIAIRNGKRAFADIDDAHCVGIGAQPEEHGMAEAENASITPDESEAERQDRENHIQRDLQQGVQIQRHGQPDQQHIPTMPTRTRAALSEEIVIDGLGSNGR